MKSMAVFITILIISSSCKLTIQGITNDYRKLNDTQKAKIIQLKDFNNLRPGTIYLINAVQLKTEILKYPKTIVYLFTNGCTSIYCKPLSVYEKYALMNDYKIFFVMTGFADLDKTTDQEINYPLFAVDNKYYKSKLRPNYVTYFTNDLLDKPLKAKESEYQGSLYFFKYGKFEKILRDLP